MIESLLPHADVLRESFESAGFRLVAAELVTQRIASSWRGYAERLQAGGDSILARLAQEELEDGLAAIRRHADGADASTLAEPIDLFVFC